MWIAVNYGNLYEICSEEVYCQNFKSSVPKMKTIENFFLIAGFVADMQIYKKYVQLINMVLIIVKHVLVALLVSAVQIQVTRAYDCGFTLFDDHQDDLTEEKDIEAAYWKE